MLVILGVPMEDLMKGSSLAIREIKNAPQLFEV
jgi:hypothetical protein